MAAGLHMRGFEYLLRGLPLRHPAIAARVVKRFGPAVVRLLVGS
jgi:hypothetical protein